MGFYNVTEYSYPAQGITEFRIFSHGVKTDFIRSKSISVDDLAEADDLLGIDKSDDAEWLVQMKHDRSVRESAKRSKQTIYQLARANIWDYFLTLTFDRSVVDSSNYSEVVTYIGKLFNHYRDIAPDIKYLLVPELHSDMIHYHVHGLISNIGNLKLVDSGHKDFTGNIIYNLKNYHGGFSTVTAVKDVRKVSSYITKYITKSLTDSLMGKRRFWASKNLDHPIVKQYNLETDILKDTLLAGNVIYTKSVSCALSGNTIQYIQISDYDKIN